MKNGQWMITAAAAALLTFALPVADSLADPPRSCDVNGINGTSPATIATCILSNLMLPESYASISPASPLWSTYQTAEGIKQNTGYFGDTINITYCDGGRSNRVVYCPIMLSNKNNSCNNSEMLVELQEALEKYMSKIAPPPPCIFPRPIIMP